MNRYQKLAFSIAAGGGTTNFEFDPLDLSLADSLHAILEIDTIGVDGGDTFNAYLQSRGPDGVWNDRVAFTQFLGTASDEERIEAWLQKFGTGSDDEEESERSGSTGASSLTAGTVLNGPFPPPYRGDIDRPGQLPGANWRLRIVVVDADSDAFITGKLWLGADAMQ